MGSWICSNSGVRVEPFEFTADMVDLEDIATHLSNKNRYTGAIALSVAQHSVALATCLPLSVQGRRKALMHDACEAYWPDMPRPLKRDPRYPQWMLDAEDYIQRTIEDTLGIEPASAEEEEMIRFWDVAICSIEAPLHFKKLHTDWVFPQDLDRNICAKLRNTLMLLWTPPKAKKAFLEVAKRLEIPK